MATCKEVFEKMPAQFDAEAAGDWEAKIQYEVEGDGGGNWVIEVAGGSCTVTDGTADDVSATVKVDAETWVGIAEKTIDPMQAFFSGKIAITGNMGDVNKSLTVFKRD
jgi:putative sterol carrier protein